MASPNANRALSGDVDAIRSWLREEIAALLELSPDGIDPQTPILAYGLDSMHALRLTVRVASRVGRSLSPLLLWEHPTLDALASHIAGDGRGEPTLGTAALDDRSSSRAEEPVAIVGIACRLPGAGSPAAFWKMLCDGVDAISEVPAERYDVERFYDSDRSAPGKMCTRWGGFLDRMDHFDAEFFGISPREAARIDPQQRLMLELACEGLEDAGIPVHGLRGATAGVFVGAMGSEFASSAYRDAESVAQHTASGSDIGLIAGRVSYCLGLRGPSLTVSTACSSSLVAIHLACASLRRGESSLAVAGGVNALLSPETTIAMSKLGALSPTGRCHAFDAAADGYVRSEGGGVVILKPLSLAVRDGDRIYATIRGSAVNNDGASHGLTAPSPAAQEALLRAACASAGIAEGELDYVEAHGTGTPLGDPIEAGALGKVHGRNRSSPLAVGSVKTNLGHLEGAAGVAGLIKTALGLHHRWIPPSLHFARPNPLIDFEALGLAVVVTGREWPRSGASTPRAGVSAFGIGGTNCHLVVEGSARPGLAVALAAPDEDALRSQAREVTAALSAASERGLELACCREIAERGSPGSSRVAIAACSASELAGELTHWANGDASSAASSAGRARCGEQPIFVYPGLGGLWDRMGCGLFESQPVFRRELELCSRVIEAEAGWSLLEELLAPRSRTGDPRHLDFVTPASIALQLAMSELWNAWGVSAAAVVGTSWGEIAAARCAGLLTRRDAMTLALRVGAAYQDSTRGGAELWAVRLSRAALGERWSDAGVEVIGENAPDSIVISGRATALRPLIEELTSRGVFVAKLSDMWAHGERAAPYFESLRSWRAEGPARDRPTIPMYSSVLGAWLDREPLGGAYWFDNAVRPIRFRGAIEALASAACRAFVELAPRPVLGGAIRTTLAAASQPAVVVATAARGDLGSETALASAVELHAHGVAVDWPAVLDEGIDPDARRNLESKQATRARLFVLSARTPGALEAHAAQLREHIARSPSLNLDDVAFSLATTRSHFEYRLALVARAREELLEGLAVVASGGTPVHASRAGPGAEPGRTAFLFTGQGSHYPGMGRPLYDAFPIFRQALDRSAESLATLFERPLLDVMFALEGSEDAALLERTDYAQPALFALGWALAELWQSFGVVPDAVLGHSLGEYVAACVAGVFAPEDALRLIVARGRLMQALPDAGAMLSCHASPDRVAALGRPWQGALSIAAFNGPEQVVISGRRDAIEAISAALAADGVAFTPLRVAQGFHSPLMDPLLEPIEALFRSVELCEPRLPLVSNLTGALVLREVTEASYWRRHVREPVQFEAGMHALAALGVQSFVELGPRPVLLGLGARSVERVERSARRAAAANQAANSLPSLRRGAGEEVLLGSLGQLFSAGASIDWDGVFAPGTCRRVALPHYPFQRTQHRVPRFEMPHELLDRSGLIEAIAAETGLSADVVRKTVDALRVVTAREQGPAAANVSTPSERAPPQRLAQRLAELPGEQHLAAIESTARREVARVLALAESANVLDKRFASIGLDSLMALQVANALGAELGQRLPPTLLFAFDTMETLSRHLLHRWLEGQSHAPAATEEASATDPYCLSPAQRRFWYLDRLVPENCLYNVLSVTRIRGRLDPSVLRRSLGEVVRRHEVLRTLFEDDAGRPRRTVLATHDLDLPFSDQSTSEDREAAAQSIASELGSRPFDLAREIPIRAALIALDEDEHDLVIVVHHIATDGWSQGVFRRELFATYRALSSGKPATAPFPAPKYADALSWYDGWLGGAECAAERRFWSEKLRGMPLLALPADRSPPAERSFRGGSVRFAWPPELGQRLKRMAAEAGSTPFQVLCACYAALLARYSGQTDFGVGTISANRNSHEVADVIGPFINTLVLRCDLSGNPSFSDFLARVRAIALEAFDHGRLPFDEIVQAVSSGPPAGRQGELGPLFRHCFALQSFPASGAEGAPLDLSWWDASPNPAGAMEGTAKFDLNLVMAERDGRLGGIFEYSSDLFDAASVEGMVRSFEALATSAVADPACPIFDLPLLSDGELAALPDAAAGAEPRVQELFQTWAERAPDAVALAIDGETLSYRELDEATNRLAHHLRELGVGPDRLVGICLDRSLDLVAGLLAILKAGGAILPLDPTYPAAWLGAIVEDAGARVVLTRQRLLPRVPVGSARVVLVDVDEAAIRARSPARLDALGGRDSHAYVIHQPSGSGLREPQTMKRAYLRHRAFSKLLASVARALNAGPNDRLLALSMIASELSALEIFLPLAVGARLEIATRALAADGEALRRRVEESAITLLVAPPATWWMLLDSGWQGVSAGSLRAVVDAERLPPELGRRLGECAASVWGAYGFPEATVWSFLQRFEPDDPAGPGQPIAGMSCRVLDGRGRPVPPGVVGELHVSGGGLAPGVGPLCRTGERYRARSSGFLERVDRLDSRVRVRGFWIEPAEIVAVLANHPAVRQAEVRAAEARPGEQRLTAFVVADEREGLAALLRDHVRAALPDYMTPSAFVRLEALSEASSIPAQVARVAPSGHAEQTVAALWREVLGHDDFGAEDDFFAVGGHSLLLVRVVNALDRAFGRRFRVAELFRHTTVGAIARALAMPAEALQEPRRPALAPNGGAARVAASGDDTAPLPVQFDERAARAPRATALQELAGAGVTYEALARRSVDMAARLAEAGVGPGSLVGLEYYRSIDYVAALLGVLRLGAPFVPLPPAYPRARTDAIIAFAGIGAIARADGIERVSSSLVRGSRPDAVPSVDDACVVLASSGSTGQPKLIVRSQRSFLHRIRWTHRSLPYDELDVCCQKSHMTTTHAFYELFEPLLGGVPTLLLPDAVAADVEAFWERVATAGVTRLLLVPSFLRASLDLPGFAPPSSLRALTLMGEALDPALAARAVAALPSQLSVHSIYGTTEASSTLLCDVRADLRAGRLPLGRPLDPSIGVEVLDEHGAPVPPGGEGFLHISGDALFSEYLNEPELTARAFARGAPGSPRRYNTCDRVRIDADGALEFLGRADHTVKIRGFRVDLGEVERLLLEHSGVSAAAALVGSDASGTQVLTSFVTPSDVDRAALLDHLRLALPPHMVPGRVYCVNELPRTASGKIDRQSLASLVPA